jgi:6-phosphogluconolactonase
MKGLDVASLQIVPTKDVPGVGASWIAAHLAQSVTARGKASIALAGGNTPRAIYEELASSDVPWDRVDVFFGDERCVPPDHPDSNFSMASLALLDRVHAPHVHRIHGEWGDHESAAAEYEHALPDSLDVILLGMGEDGHTASLFPGHDWSRPTGRKVIAVSGAPKPPSDRLSVTPDVIWAARARLVLAVGKGKAEQVRLALEDEPSPSLHPVHIVRDATWLIDPDAASLLSGAEARLH